MDRYQKVVVTLLGVIILLLVLILVFCCAKYNSVNKDSGNPSGVIMTPGDSLSAEQIAVVKSMLVNELSQKGSSSLARSNMLYQYRFLIPTFILAVFGLISTRNGNGGDTGRYLIPIVILVISVSGYWWDCYINDLQDRVDARVADIKETLILLPSLDRTQASKAITKIGAHKDLSRSDWCKKVCLLKNWRFEHFLFWVPLLALSFYLFFKSKFG